MKELRRVAGPDSGRQDPLHPLNPKEKMDMNTLRTGMWWTYLMASLALFTVVWISPLKGEEVKPGTGHKGMEPINTEAPKAEEAKKEEPKPWLVDFTFQTDIFTQYVWRGVAYSRTARCSSRLSPLLTKGFPPMSGGTSTPAREIPSAGWPSTGRTQPGTRLTSPSPTAGKSSRT